MARLTAEDAVIILSSFKATAEEIFCVILLEQIVGIAVSAVFADGFLMEKELVDG